MNRATSLALFAAILVTVSACTGQSGSSVAPTAPSPTPGSTPAPSPTVMKVTVSGAAAVGSFQLVATAERSDHTIENATTSATWTSSDPSVARVAAGGFVTVVQNGTVDFTATYQGVAGALHAAVSVPAKYTISGVVTDADTGKAIPNVRVQVLGDDPETTTDIDGKYTLRNVTSGRNFVEFTAAGYDVKEKDVSLASDVTLLVTLSATKPSS
jgi:hypothetical protein